MQEKLAKKIYLHSDISRIDNFIQINALNYVNSDDNFLGGHRGC